MDNTEFKKVRRYLDKTQSQLAELLCVSPKAVQSFEQGWRRITADTERQLLFLLYCKTHKNNMVSPCWEVRKCPSVNKEKCAAWEYQFGNYCWFITGTFCNGESQGSWEKKTELCRRCDVFKSMLAETPLTWLDKSHKC